MNKAKDSFVCYKIPRYINKIINHVHSETRNNFHVALYITIENHKRGKKREHRTRTRARLKHILIGVNHRTKAQVSSSRKCDLFTINFLSLSVRNTAARENSLPSHRGSAPLYTRRRSVATRAPLHVVTDLDRDFMPIVSWNSNHERCLLHC